MKRVYLIVGVPCAGKSWVCEQVQDKIKYVHHDLYTGMGGRPYVEAILKALVETDAVLAEAPFSLSNIVGPLLGAGVEVWPLFIIEPVEVLRARYWKRENKEIPRGHVTRQQTYAQRCEDGGFFRGTSTEVLTHLHDLLEARRWEGGEWAGSSQRTASKEGGEPDPKG